MKLKTAILTLTILMSITNTNAKSEAEIKELNWRIYDLLKEANTARDDSVVALEMDFNKEFARQKCKQINALENLITLSNNNSDNSSVKEIGVTATKTLNKVLIEMMSGSVKKEDVCNYGLS